MGPNSKHFASQKLFNRPALSIIMKIKRGVEVILILFFTLAILVFALLFARAASPREIDDIHPNIFCEGEYVEWSDILWVIPKYQNVGISENKTWCKEILAMNKTLGMHGIYHTYEEFNSNIDQTYLDEGINEFKKCFGYPPTMFKPPQLEINEQNKKLVESRGMKIKTKLNQAQHKVYHCENSGEISNLLLNFI